MERWNASVDVGVPVGDIFSAGGEKRLAPMDGEEGRSPDESGSPGRNTLGRAGVTSGME